MKKNLYIFLSLMITGHFCLSQINTSCRISLLSDGNTSLTVYHDEPVVFSVTLTNPEARFASAWNAANEKDITELNGKIKNDPLQKENYLKEIERLRSIKKETMSYNIGSKQEPWFNMLKWEILSMPGNKAVSLPEFLSYQQMDTVAILDADAYYKAYFGISETEIQKWNAGKYQVRAVCGLMISEPVELTIKIEKMPATTAESVSMLLKMGNYYWLSANPDKALQSVQKILNKDPGFPDAFVLRAEIFIQKKDYVSALKDFQNALQQYNKRQPNQFEPPEYLLGMIAWLKEQK